MITRNFISKVRLYFNELHLPAKNGITFEKFQDHFIKIINRCKDIISAKMAIDYFSFCRKKWNKIEKIFTNHLSKWQEFEYSKGITVFLLTNDQSYGIYTIANYISERVNDIYLTSNSFDNELYDIDLDDKKISIFEDSDYYLCFSKSNSQKMILYTKNDDPICDIYVNNFLELYLKNNQTNFEIITDKNNIFVFEESYLDSLDEDEEIDLEKTIANYIGFHQREKESNIRRMILYEEMEDDEFEILLYIMLAHFLLEVKWMKNMNSLLLFSFLKKYLKKAD